MSGSQALASCIRKTSSHCIHLGRPVGLNFRSPTGLGAREISLRKGAEEISCALGPRAKAEFDRSLGFPGGSDGKESVCSAGDSGLIPGSGRSPREGNGNPLQYFCLENCMDSGVW